ncbi:helicase-related protein [Thermus brockianus]|jgi:superfamily II DNA or RNA helicase
MSAVDFHLGSLVRYRGRNWVVVDRQGEFLHLRPLAASEGGLVPVHRGLMEALRDLLPHEALTPSQFPAPSPEKPGSYQTFSLFAQGAQLLLRDGVAPLRSLGRVGVRPRPYQLVPLLMALRLDPVRLLIADDVGVGKTVEAGLIARELLDRKLARRLAVLVPPHLIEQWVEELRTKFALDPVVVSSGSLARLEREVPPGENVYAVHRVIVASIDFVKHERHRPLFLAGAPDLVIVDEAHGAVGGPAAASQQRYELVRALAEDPTRHLLLLTATPHSGIPEAFSRLMGLLDPEFGAREDLLSHEAGRARLAQHFVQRTRKDIAELWEKIPLFPERQVIYPHYTLTPEYRALYERAFTYARAIVRGSEGLGETQRRLRWWGALALLRSVMSSPRSAQAALERRLGREEVEALEGYAPWVYEGTEAPSEDEVPSPLLQLVESARKGTLQELRRLAKAITPERDAKLQGLLTILEDFLRRGHHPVVWCHFVDTAEYVGEAVRARFPQAHVAVVTGRMEPSLRREAVEALMEHAPRILVATDCVSEGINLQRGFTAVVHYDLPWNPNRLEQREGRVDRFGQRAKEVVVARYRGKDNPVDEKVVNVLLRKAEEIRRALGVYVPVPDEERYVVDRMVRELFYSEAQPLLFAEALEAEERWGRDVEREGVSRSRFAQRTLRPEEVLASLEETDAVLGSPEAVRAFVLLAARFLSLGVKEAEGVVTLLPHEDLPEGVREVFSNGKGKLRPLRLAFADPAPDGVQVAGRTHPLVVALARHFFERPLVTNEGRYAVWRVAGIPEATYLYLLRPRYRIRERQAEVLGEEVRLLALRGGTLLPEEEARRLLEADPAGDLEPGSKKNFASLALDRYEEAAPLVEAFLRDRARAVREAHRSVRRASRQRVGDVVVEPVPPPDLLAFAVLLPAR